MAKPSRGVQQAVDVSRGNHAGGQAEGMFAGTTGYVYLVAGVAALAGLLFGYDTGVISGAQSLIVKQFHLSSGTQELAVASVLIGCIVGAAIGGKLADWAGRKKILILWGIVFAAGAILTAFSWGLASFVAFRILVGIAVGGGSVVAPMYTTETVPPRVRGFMVFLFQFAITVGLLVAYLVDYGFLSFGMSWPWMFGLGAVPGIILAVGMLFLPDTPRWLASRDRWDEAEQVLDRVAPRQKDETLQMIRETIDKVQHARLREFFGGPLKWALVTGVSLAALQQFVGINTIIYYGTVVAGYTGANGKSLAGHLIGAIIFGAVNCVATAVAVFLVDKTGRRPFLLGGTFGIVLCLVAVGLLFLFPLSQFSGYLMMAFVSLYLVFFEFGLGPVYWLLSSELFPTRYRGTGASISTIGNWGANLAVTLSFLTMTSAIGKPATFFIYAFWGLFACVFIFVMVPETKNKPLEQIEDYWQNHEQLEHIPFVHKEDHAA